MEDASSPFFPHHGDNPGISLVSQTLTGENYHTWSRLMVIALSAKNKLGFVEGTIRKPSTEDQKYEKWIRCNNMILSWILNSVSETIASSIMFIDSAEDMWKELKERFSQGYGPRVFQIKKSIASLSQDNLPVSEYYTRLRALWKELSNLRPIPECACGSFKLLLAYHQQEQILQFLMGLNESFAHVRGQILLMEPIPPLNKVFSLILKDEQQRFISTPNIRSYATISESTHTSHGTNTQISLRSENRPVCLHCGETGHVIEKCLKLHGFAPGFKTNRSKNISAPTKTTGSFVTRKPSLNAKNRERRNEIKQTIEGQKGSVLRPGMVLLKNYTSHSDQVGADGASSYNRSASEKEFPSLCVQAHGKNRCRNVRTQIEKTSAEEVMADETPLTLDQSHLLCIEDRPTHAGNPVSGQTSENIEGNESSKEPSDRFKVVDPYDIWPTKTTGSFVTLKPSLDAKNRERRNEIKRTIEGQKGSVLRPGMVLLKNYISHSDQVKIVKMCRDLGLGPGGFYQPRYRAGAKLHLNMMCLGKNWDPEKSEYRDIRSIDGAKPPRIPDEFCQLVKGAIQESHALIEKDLIIAGKAEEVLPRMVPDICIVNFYTTSGRLGLHQDKDESEESLRRGSPVVSFSVGDSAEFLYGDQRDVEKADKVILESGDVLIFGGKSRHVFHGIPAILPNSAPKSLLEETNLRVGRLNLTFKQY